MIRALYSLLMWLGQPLMWRKLMRRGRVEPGYLQAVPERWGHYSTPASSGWIWIHAVSLGETRAAAQLLQELRLALPGMRLLLTHGTATGREEGQKLLNAGDMQVWQPWDSTRATRRFLAHFRPALGILIETEVWPNLTAQCVRAGIPLVLANARLSELSARRAQRLRWLAQPAYVALSAVWAQTPADAQRLSALGAPVQAVLGNIKFDAHPDAAQLASGRAWRQRSPLPVVMLASSREGEEQLWLQAIAQLPATPPIQWLVVPRHPQRFDAVAQLLGAHGFSVSRRSQWDDGPRQAQVWLGDSMGEMALYYALSDVALLGGSFAPLGGQNLIEAAACACPVVTGPHTFNFDLAARLAVQAGAALRASDMAQAVGQAAELAADGTRLEQVRQRARRFAAAHQGAAAATASAIASLLQRA